MRSTCRTQTGEIPPWRTVLNAVAFTCTLRGSVHPVDIPPNMNAKDVAQQYCRKNYLRSHFAATVHMSCQKMIETVPMHDEVKVGTLAGILRQADISAEDFINAS